VVEPAIYHTPVEHANVVELSIYHNFVGYANVSVLYRGVVD
jgi:hypothetical protein